MRRQRVRHGTPHARHATVLVSPPRGRGRQSVRLRAHDYAAPGAYFITICVHERRCLFGEIVLGADAVGVTHASPLLNGVGKIVETCWVATPLHFPHVQMDAFVVMPNHLHGIILITGQATNGSPMPMGGSTLHARGPRRGSIGAVVGSFKAAVIRQVRAIPAPVPASPLRWQRGYYDHVIRDEGGLHRIRRYIAENPGRWADSRRPPR